MSRRHWRSLMRSHGIRPDRRLGQNFLVESWALDRVVRAAELTGDETVLEIGAGLGALTILLAQEARSVTAVEFDSRLIPALEETVAPFENVTIIVGDALQLNLQTVMSGQEYSVVANIPYNITSALIRKLMEATLQPSHVILTVQQEVAERITAGPGEMSLLALSVQIYGVPTIEARLPSGAFVPEPEVDSAVLKIELDQSARYGSEQVDAIFEIARAGFGQRRKQLRNALASGLGEAKEDVDRWLESAGLAPKARAQELTVDQWRLLAEASGRAI